MRTKIAACGVFVMGLCWMALAGQGGTPEKPKEETAKQEAAKADAVDITAKVKELNSDKYAAPSTTFRVGHIKPRQLDPKAVTAAKDGFRIQLPSKAPIPTPTIYDGKLYASGGFHSKEFYCFDALTGKLVWAVDLDDDGPTSCVVESDVVVFNTESCTIFALDAKTGKHLWSYFLGDPLTSTPTIADDKVFTSYPANGGGGGDAPNQAKARPPVSHVLACFELKTGKILWQRWIDSDVMSAPIASGTELYCTSFGGTVYKFHQAKGDIISAQQNRATSAPIVVGNNVYMTKRADTGGKGVKAAESIVGVRRQDDQPTFAGPKREALYLDAEVQGLSQLKAASEKLDASNGFSAGAPAAANPAAAEKNIGQVNVSSMQAFQGSRLLHYSNNNYNCMGDEIVCTDPADGKTRWSVKLTGDLKKEGGHLAAPPAAAGGQIFLSTLEGNILQMDPAKGTLTKTYKVNAPLRSQPAIVGGRLYVGTQDGQIVCVDTGNPQFTGWTTWGANSGHTNVVEKK